MIVEILIALVLLLVLAMLIMMLKLSGKLGKISLDQETVKGAIATCWKELGVDQDIGAIKERANDIQTATQSLENLFRVTRGRGEYGEFQLEQILKPRLALISEIGEELIGSVHLLPGCLKGVSKDTTTLPADVGLKVNLKKFRDPFEVECQKNVAL